MTAIATLFFHMRDAGRAQVEKNTVGTARTLIQVVDGELMRVQGVALALSTSDELARRDFGALRRRTRSCRAASVCRNSSVCHQRVWRALHPGQAAQSAGISAGHN